MTNQLVMMIHATTGVLAMLSALWLFVETLNANPVNRPRINLSATFTVALMWITYFIAGYWYVTHYGAEKAIIKAGPFPAAHGFFMETKEHIFLLLLLLATWLVIAVYRATALEGPTKTLVLWGSGLLVLGTLAMEGTGALVSLGVKVALLPD